MENYGGLDHQGRFCVLTEDFEVPRGGFEPPMPYGASS